VQQTIDLRLEGHDAASDAEYDDNGAGHQRRVKMQVKQELAHAMDAVPHCRWNPAR
jgi:hypothetical protein